MIKERTALLASFLEFRGFSEISITLLNAHKSIKFGIWIS